MYAPSAHRSLINFRDLRGHDIHIFTAMSGSEEVLELRQGPRCLATTCTGAIGLYELPISSSTTDAARASLSSRLSPQACAVSLSKAELKTPQELVDSVFTVNFPAKTGLWYGWMGHPGATMFRKMILILTGHEVCSSNANKVGVCTTCAQGKLIQHPSRWKLPSELPPRL